MLMGADVTHATNVLPDSPAMALSKNGRPPPEQPSVAAVVASTDK